MAAALDISAAFSSSADALQLVPGAAPVRSDAAALSTSAGGLLAVPRPLLDEALAAVRQLLPTWRSCGTSQRRLNAAPPPDEAVKVPAAGCQLFGFQPLCVSKRKGCLLQYTAGGGIDSIAMSRTQTESIPQHLLRFQVAPSFKQSF